MFSNSDNLVVVGMTQTLSAPAAPCSAAAAGAAPAADNTPPARLQYL